MKPKKSIEGLCPEGMDLVLPWYVNGTLEEDERKNVERHLLECPVCRQELDAIRNEREKYHHAVAEDMAIPRTFPKLIAKIEKEEKRGVWQRFSSFIPSPRLRPAFGTALIAIQFLVILCLIGIFAMNPWGTGERLYRTLSGPVTSVGKGPRLTILFQEGAREKTIRDLLLEMNGTIVSGPTPMGVYTVELKPDVKPEEIQKIVTDLSERKDIIRFIGRESG
jgi:hypothetical protein